MSTDDTVSSPSLSDDERAVLESVCDEIGVPPRLVAALIEEETKVFGMGRRHLIWTQLDSLFREFVTSNDKEDK
ncbi:MAG: hypothetical protein HYX68_27140 [Planctomycetes bacterium]|nr:hypothetical protein [Planctomycetota bacterium]